MARSSRSSLKFMERMGLKVSQVAPRPRLEPLAVRVHGVDIQEDPQPEQAFLLANEGPNPPDRGVTKPWPHQGV